jgi:hypothetical protein
MGEDKNMTIKILEDNETSDGRRKVFIAKSINSDDNEIIELHTEGDSDTRVKTVIIDSETSGDSDDAIFVATDGAKPLIFIDGKKANEKKMKALRPDQIESINVIKGDKAIEKHGKKAKNGVVEITTKKG